jgi:MYXO-CTERM domain-containing protein
VLAALQAGAHYPVGKVLLEQQLGPGGLDLAGSLQVLDAAVSPLTEMPDPEHSWLTLAGSYAHPDPEWPLVGFVELRGPNGIADGFDPQRLKLTVERATVVEALSRVAPGLWRFAVVAPAGSGGQQLSLRLAFDEKTLLQRTVAIAVDRWVAEEGVTTRGGCAVASGPASLGLWLGVLALAALLRRRRAA